MTSLFKSEQGKLDILNLYNQKLAELNIVYTTKNVHTSFGQTHIIVTGDERKPPLIIIHGSNGCAPIGLETYPNLAKHFHVFAVDVLAQPNKSTETRLDMKSNDYGQWINEIIDTLGLDQVTLAGFSFGGLIILKTLIYDESKIKSAFLAAPAYIVNGNPIKALFKVFIPMRRYMKTKKINYVNAFLKELFTEPDAFATHYLSKVFLYFDMDFSPIPTITNKMAQAIQTPMTLIAAKQDLMFPGQKMIKRAQKLFPSLTQSVLLESSKHVQNKTDNARIEKLIIDSIA